MKHGGVKEDLTWKIVILFAALLTVVHTRCSSSVLSKLCLSFVLKVLLRIRLFSTENWAKKNSNKMNSVAANFSGQTDQN